MRNDSSKLFGFSASTLHDLLSGDRGLLQTLTDDLNVGDTFKHEFHHTSVQNIQPEFSCEPIVDFVVTKKVASLLNSKDKDYVPVIQTIINAYRTEYNNSQKNSVRAGIYGYLLTGNGALLASIVNVMRHEITLLSGDFEYDVSIISVKYKREDPKVFHRNLPSNNIIAYMINSTSDKITKRPGDDTIPAMNLLSSPDFAKKFSNISYGEKVKKVNQVSPKKSENLKIAKRLVKLLAINSVLTVEYKNNSNKSSVFNISRNPVYIATRSNQLSVNVAKEISNDANLAIMDGVGDPEDSTILVWSNKRKCWVRLYVSKINILDTIV